ncbi:hypothetical protein B0H14DRAFT_3157142 [Mycena olivaceomarginata]|nr:hypothetical protein B0H14DRAFT_3157142 [Mycena olivaceomarginata]
MSSSLHPSHFCLFQLLCSFLPQLCSPHLQPFEPPVVIICRGNVTTYDLDRLRPGQVCALVGCHKVAVPRLNEYKVHILPQVQDTAQCGVPVPPAFFCRFLCASLFYVQSDPRSFDPTIVYVSNITPSACGNVQSSIRTSRPCQSHTSNISKMCSVLGPLGLSSS